MFWRVGCDWDGAVKFKDLKCWIGGGMGDSKAYL